MSSTRHHTKQHNKQTTLTSDSSAFDDATADVVDDADDELLTSSTRTAATRSADAASAATAADGYMIRAEERLVVGKETVSAGTAQLNKFVTSEHVYTTVPVSKEHAVLRSEPISEADNIIVDGISEAHFEMPLAEERAIASKKAVAVEKVMLTKETEQSTDVVGADLKKENIAYAPAAETAEHINIRKH